VEYGVASGTLSFNENKSGSKFPPPVEIPNVPGKMSQFKKLLALRESCLKGDGGELVLVRRAGERTPGEALPGRRRGIKPAPDPVPPVEIVIDAEKLSRLREETESLSQRLAGIFERDAPQEPAKPEPAALNEKNRRRSGDTDAAALSDLPFPPAALNRLDPKHVPVLRELLDREARSRDPWSAEEWATLARRHGFMPNALMEDLNTWGEEALGDLLVFDDDGPILNRDVLTALHNEHGALYVCGFTPDAFTKSPSFGKLTAK
jgi:hypothetical protein